jgi:hypothetical protein
MTDSWWLKFKRAQQHMVDIRREARRYADSHPYDIVPIRQPRPQENPPRFRLRITQQPDPCIAIMLGDFIHNLRSALDHVVVAASSPRSTRKNASFPISTEDLWAKDSNGEYVVCDEERRESFLRAIAGLNHVAKATVIACQPYHVPEQASDNILTLLSRLENADKHREMITISTGVKRPVLTLTSGDEVSVRPSRLGRWEFLKDGAEINLTGHPPGLLYPEVHVKCRGAASISVQVADGARNNPPTDFNLIHIMRIALSSVRFILRKMEPFVIR